MADYSSDTRLVSVLIATYAGDDLRYFQEAVASVLSQDYVQLEVVVVSDGPLRPEQDEFLGSIEDSRVSVHRLKQNSGPAIARNHGVQFCRGEFVVVMDSDDVAEPNRVSQQLAYLTANNLDVVGSAYCEIDHMGHRQSERRMPVSPTEIRLVLPFLNPVANPTVLIKRKLLAEFGFHPKFRYGEDYRLWLRLARAGYAIGNHPQALLRHRVDENHLRRRNGIHRAYTDLVNKLYGLSIAPIWMAPLVIAGAIGSFFLRLMPWQVVALFVRARTAFSSGKG